MSASCRRAAPPPTPHRWVPGGSRKARWAQLVDAIEVFGRQWNDIIQAPLAGVLQQLLDILTGTARCALKPIRAPLLFPDTAQWEHRRVDVRLECSTLQLQAHFPGDVVAMHARDWPETGAAKRNLQSKRHAGIRQERRRSRKSLAKPSDTAAILRWREIEWDLQPLSPITSGCCISVEVHPRPNPANYVTGQMNDSPSKIFYSTQLCFD